MTVSNHYDSMILIIQLLVIYSIFWCLKVFFHLYNTPLIMELLSLIITSGFTLMANTFSLFCNFPKFHILLLLFWIDILFEICTYYLINMYLAILKQSLSISSLESVIKSFEMYFLLLILAVLCVWTFVFIEMVVTISKPQINITPFLRLHKQQLSIFVLRFWVNSSSRLL